MIKEKRRYHLGLDWGTSTTKLVLRDYEQQKAFVLMPAGMAHSYRYPSTIVRSDDRIYFGFNAEERRKKADKVIDALKADLCILTVNEGCAQKTSEQEDLATLFLAHIISLGLNSAEEHAKRDKAQALMGMTIGFPAEEIEKSSLKHIYMRMAQSAYELAVRSGYDPQGKRYDQACEQVANVRGQIEARGGFVSSSSSYHQWLRPELAAAMYWGIKSPMIERDLYSCIDIGAWTTNTSYFRIGSSPGTIEKDSIIFFGGATGGPGVIKLLKNVAEEHNQDFISMLGCEEEWLRRRTYVNHIEWFKKGCFEVWKRGFHQAYKLEPKQSAWDGKVNIMVVGGGSKIPEVRQHFLNAFPYPSWKSGPSVPDLGTPSDLFNFPDQGMIPRQPFAGDYTFLLVAYGLSVHSGDFPKTTLGPQVPPFDAQPRVRAFRDSSDLGYDEK